MTSIPISLGRRSRETPFEKRVFEQFVKKETENAPEEK